MNLQLGLISMNPDLKKVPVPSESTRVGRMGRSISKTPFLSPWPNCIAPNFPDQGARLIQLEKDSLSSLS